MYNIRIVCVFFFCMGVWTGGAKRCYAQEKNQALLMMGYVVCMMSVSTIYLFKINTPEALQKCKDLWAYMKHQSPLLYKHVHASYAGWTNRRTVLGRKIALLVYAICQRIFKFA